MLIMLYFKKLFLLHQTCIMLVLLHNCYLLFFSSVKHKLIKIELTVVFLSFFISFCQNLLNLYAHLLSYVTFTLFYGNGPNKSSLPDDDDVSIYLLYSDKKRT